MVSVALSIWRAALEINGHVYQLTATGGGGMGGVRRGRSTDKYICESPLYKLKLASDVRRHV